MMNQHLKDLWRMGKKNASNQAEQALEHTCAGRVINALTFIVIILCLGSWIGFFLLLKEQLPTQSLVVDMFTNITCIIFFGGLVAAIFVGAMVGNFLRRAFWKLLVKHTHLRT